MVFQKKVIPLHPDLKKSQPIARKDARVVEEARLESVYTPKGYREFESRSLRNNTLEVDRNFSVLFLSGPITQLVRVADS